MIETDVNLHKATSLLNHNYHKSYFSNAQILINLPWNIVLDIIHITSKTKIFSEVKQTHLVHIYLKQLDEK